VPTASACLSVLSSIRSRSRPTVTTFPCW
jgi:hypothetical protein